MQLCAFDNNQRTETYRVERIILNSSFIQAYSLITLSFEYQF
jgi:hypothetical protein